MTLQEKLEESKRTGILDIEGMGLRVLPPLPSMLTHLYCSDNQLSTLPNLPSTLTHLLCSRNQLHTLPQLPSTLIHVYCSDNILHSLPDLPPRLRLLYCSCNQLGTLPRLPSTLTHLYCSWNQLRTLPLLPSTLELLICYDNPYTPVFANLTIINDTMSTRDIIHRIRAYYANIQRQSRDSLALQYTLGKGNNCILNDDCLSTIGYFLSGQRGTLPMQLISLRTLLE
jgi:hypothetical protein